MSEKEYNVCCGCCLPNKCGLIVYCAVFMVLVVLGIWNYMPLYVNPESSYPLTFDNLEWTSHLEEYCSSETSCPMACSCDGKPCNFEQIAGTIQTGQRMLFAASILYIGTMGVGIGGAVAKMTPLLLGYIGCSIFCVLLQIIGVAVASHPNNLEMTVGVILAFEWDPNADCSQKYKDGVEAFLGFGQVTGIVAFIIFTLIEFHTWYVAYMLQKEIKEGVAIPDGCICGTPRAADTPTVTATATVVKAPEV